MRTTRASEGTGADGSSRGLLRRAESSRRPAARGQALRCEDGRRMGDALRPHLRSRAGGAAPRRPAREPRRLVARTSPRAPTRRCGPTGGAASCASTSTWRRLEESAALQGRPGALDAAAARRAVTARPRRDGAPRVAPPADLRSAPALRGGRALRAAPPPPLRGGRRLRHPRRAPRRTRTRRTRASSPPPRRAYGRLPAGVEEGLLVGGRRGAPRGPLEQLLRRRSTARCGPRRSAC